MQVFESDMIYDAIHAGLLGYGYTKQSPGNFCFDLDCAWLDLVCDAGFLGAGGHDIDCVVACVAGA